MDDPVEDLGSLLDAKLLALFVLLYGTRSVTRTAEQLGQNQPTVSVWLARLRRQFDDPLFVRTGAGMQPTPRADALIGPMREALAALRRLSTPTRTFVAAESKRTYRIGMTDAGHITVLPNLLTVLRETAPGVRIDAALIDEHTAQALESGRVELALGIIPELESGFYQQTFYEQDFVCLVNPRHARLQASLTLKMYRQEAHIEVLSGRSHALVDAALKAQRIERRVMLQLPGFLGLAAVVASTDLVATVPREIGETLAAGGALRVFRCPFPIEPFTVKQYWHARFHHDEAHRWLRAACAAIYQQRAKGRSA